MDKNEPLNPYCEQQIITDVLRNKIEMEEETLQLLAKSELLADDQKIHYQMICTQQKIVDFYKDLLDKVSTITTKH